MKVDGLGGFYYFREAQVPCNSYFTIENSGFRVENAFFGKDSP